MTEIAPREITPPPLQAPTAKEKKYDRQLRLWAASGQRALEESHVLLVVGDEGHGSNSSVAGAETLKNLILPSVGSFTIADSATVTERDLGVNFFLDSSSLNKPRAEETRRLLQELNPDVTGHAITSPLSQWLPVEDSLKPYNLILLCAPIAQDLLKRICAYASSSSIPVMYIQSEGFFASFSVQLPAEFPIVDTHPDPESIQDLRLLAPWPELNNAVERLGDISALPDHEHGHVPYILLLLYYLREWGKTHNDKYPSTFKEKTEFRDLVRSGARTDNPEGGEENYDEACAAVLKSIAPPPIGSGCKEMMDMPSCANLTKESANFWVVANAIKRFYDVHAVLPLPGALPDMKATSADYIHIQTIYKSKARLDVAEVTRFVRSTEASLSRTNSPISDSEIEAFCKNASHVRVLTNSNNEPLPSLRLMTSDSKIAAQLSSIIENDWESVFPVFLALNAGVFTSGSPLDLAKLSSDSEIQENITKAVEEAKRAQGGELHNISSVLGGMVAQEAIKLLTRQYVPVDGICVFDGVRKEEEEEDEYDEKDEDIIAIAPINHYPTSLFDPLLLHKIRAWWTANIAIPISRAEGRLHIENENTFLAWFSMGIAMFMFGMACVPSNFGRDQSAQERYRWLALSAFCMTLASVYTVVAAFRFLRQQHALHFGWVLVREFELYVIASTVFVAEFAALVMLLSS